MVSFGDAKNPIYKGNTKLVSMCFVDFVARECHSVGASKRDQSY